MNRQQQPAQQQLNSELSTSRSSPQNLRAAATESTPTSADPAGKSAKGLKGFLSRFSSSKGAAPHESSPSQTQSSSMGNGAGKQQGNAAASSSNTQNGERTSPAADGGQSFNSLSDKAADSNVRIKIGDRVYNVGELQRLIPELEQKLRQKQTSIEEKESVVRKQNSVINEKVEKIKELENEIVSLKVECDKLRSVLGSSKSVSSTTPPPLSAVSLSFSPGAPSPTIEVAPSPTTPASPTQVSVATSPRQLSVSLLTPLDTVALATSPVHAASREKKQGISAEPDVYMTDKIKLVHHKKSAVSKQQIRDAITHNDFLKYLDADQVLEVVECMYERNVSAGNFIIREGEAGAHLYVASEGEMEVSKGGTILSKLGPGRVFGELAILYNCTRTASVKALSNVRLWVLDRAVFQMITMRLGLQRHETLMQFLHQVPLLQGLPEDRIGKIADSLEQDYYAEGTYIVREGERGDAFFIILQGEVRITQLCEGSPEPIEIRVLHKGDYFGEKALLGEEVRTASVIALAPGVEVVTLDRESFEKLIGDIQELQNRDYKDEERGARRAIDKRSSLGGKDSGYESGSYSLSSGGKPHTVPLSSPSTFPSDFSTSPSQLTPSHPIIHEDESSTSFDATATSSEHLRLDSNTTLVPDQVPAPKAAADKEFENVEISHLKPLATLGVGGFGRVELVCLSNDKSRSFALKAMKKKHIIETRQQEHIFSERNIMLELRSQFIVRLFKTFRDKKYVYMLLEACLGGELWTILRDRGHFDDMWARFYTACVVEALEFLHKRGIVYRDLKPENCLIDHTGYLKLVDFGFAKKLGGGRKTWTFCGTPEYVAPEIILNKGHDHSADFWALGIYICELLLGRPPFQAQDPMKTYTLILKGVDALDIPNRRIGKTATVLVKKLCRDNPAERLGCQSGGIEDIRKQRWFVGFDWDALRAHSLKPPFVPKITSATDVSNFDQYPPEHDVPPDEVSGWDEGF